MWDSFSLEYCFSGGDSFGGLAGVARLFYFLCSLLIFETPVLEISFFTYFPMIF